MPLLDLKKNDLASIVSHFSEQLHALRSNRASTAALENIVVEAYGSKMRLRELASLSVPEPRQIAIEPWDKTLLKEIEKAIGLAQSSMSVKNDGAMIRVSMQPMTEETRREVVKMLHQKLESAKIALRGIRDGVKEEIVLAHREKRMSEDEKFKQLEDLDALTKQVTDELSALAERKEDEIMNV